MSLSQLTKWLSVQLNTSDFRLQPLAGDASFRQYFRIHHATQSWIGVISPPASENNVGFVTISKAWRALALPVPQVIAADLTQGFLLLEDFGDRVFFREVNTDNADEYYHLALQALPIIQRCPLPLPAFDAVWMGQELQFFRQWLVEKHCGLRLSAAEEQLWRRTCELLLTAATEQPQCCIHRDYHSRNLMLLGPQQLGILDFQDAMRGPITYDLVSLIRDCYIDWPVAQVKQWADQFYAHHLQAQIASREQFHYWLDLMGIQRHLKAAFIFARKFHRDNVDNYLADLPRTLQYVIQVSDHYPALREFQQWVGDAILARLPAIALTTTQGGVTT